MSHVRLNSVSFYVNYIIVINYYQLPACTYTIVSSSLGPRPHTGCRYHFSLIPRPHTLVQVSFSLGPRPRYHHLVSFPDPTPCMVQVSFSLGPRSHTGCRYLLVSFPDPKPDPFSIMHGSITCTHQMRDKW